MIDRINTNSVNNYKYSAPKQPQFKGALEMATSAIQMCESNPMLNVAVLDLATAIIPRTVVESETNPYAGFEAFRRESSGLIINCMIPGLIVAGIAKGIGGSVMGGKTDMAKCWANEDTINLVTNYWNKAQGATDQEKVTNTFKNILKDTKGIDGEKTVDFSKFNFDESIKELTDEVFKPEFKGSWLEKISAKIDAKKVAKEAAKKAGIDYVDETPFSKIVKQTKVAENIKIAGHIDPKTGKVIDEYFTQSLGDVLGNAPKILKELIGGKLTDEAAVKAFAEKANHLVTSKSLLGLGVIIPLALSAQPINRWITEKMSGKKGAPIYKDFTQSQDKKLSKKEQAGLATQKIISVGSMIGVALLSIGKKPDAKMFKNIAQFKGIFPSMDQARIISTATFASRMASSEDKNDLREATVRDIATFSAFYFLGDYVAKGIATGIQKATGIELINIKAKLKDNANVLEKFGHWAKDTALKSSAELMDGRPRQMRALCQIGNIAFSLVALGLLIPKMNRKKTDKEREKELKQMGMDQNAINKYYPAFAMNMNGKDTKNVYNAFATSKP